MPSRQAVKRLLGMLTGVLTPRDPLLLRRPLIKVACPFEVSIQPTVEDDDRLAWPRCVGVSAWLPGASAVPHGAIEAAMRWLAILPATAHFWRSGGVLTETF
jgi:hypothetical protein